MNEWQILEQSNRNESWMATWRQAQSHASVMASQCLPNWGVLICSVTRKFCEQLPPRTIEEASARYRQEQLLSSLIDAIIHAHNMVQQRRDIAARLPAYNIVLPFRPAVADEIFAEARILCEKEWPNSEDSYRILNQGIEGLRA